MMTLEEMLREIIADYEDADWTWDSLLYCYASGRYHINRTGAESHQPEQVTTIAIPEGRKAVLLDLDYAGPRQKQQIGMKQLLTWLPQGGFDLANALDIALPRIKALGYDTVIVTGKRLGGTIPIEIIMIE